MANERPQPGGLPALSPGLLLILAGVELLAHLVVVNRYGYFRDELYYLASTGHVAWGYVDHPPLSIALLAAVRALLGDSLPALRLVAILAGAVAVFLAGVLARRLGGGRFAQGLASLCVLASPMFLGLSHFYSMNALDLLIWTAAALALLEALDNPRARHWLGLGVILGLGLLNKISVLWLGGGLLVALLATPHRRLLITPGPWNAVLVAGLLFSPYLLWQIKHGWPTLEFMRPPKGIERAQQLLAMGPRNGGVGRAHHHRRGSRGQRPVLRGPGDRGANVVAVVHAVRAGLRRDHRPAAEDGDPGGVAPAQDVYLKAR